MASGPDPQHSQASPYPAYPVQRGASRSRGIWLLIAWFLVFMLLIGLAISMAMNVALMATAGFSAIEDTRQVQQKHHSLERGAPNRIAIISIEGTILSGEGFFKKQIDRAREDDDLKAIVLRINSPGGTITGSDYIYHHLREVSEEKGIPIVVSMGSLAASGGYYVAMACGDRPDVVFAEPTTWTGSIGVIIPHYNLGQLMEDVGVEDNSIASHPLKTMGSFTRPMTEREREIFEQLVQESFGRFKEVIKSGRPTFAEDPGALDEVATGQIFSADSALEHGLIDKIGFLEAAIDRAVELTGLRKDEVEVVRYKPQPSLSDVLFGNAAQSRRLDLSQLFDSVHPRAYYLWTHLPLAASSFSPQRQ